MTATSMAALLLTNRIVEVDAKPLSAKEFWELQRKVPDLDVFLGAPAALVADRTGETEDERSAGRRRTRPARPRSR